MLELILAAATLAANPASEERWPQFRGPGSAGVGASDKLPLEWGPGRNVAWTAEIPGSGWSCPIVWDGRVFVTTAVPDRPEEPPQTGLYFGGERKDAPEIQYDWRLYCLSLDDGKVVWERSLYVGKPPRGKHVKNSFASETPATDGRNVYVTVGHIGVFCVDMNGTARWKYDLAPYATTMEWGTGSSPITDGGQVYVQCDNNDQSFLVALDVESGEPNWRIERDEDTNWSTPFLWKNARGVELVTNGKRKARAYDPATGELLWELAGMSSIVVPTPIAGDELLFVSSGYVMDMKNRPIFAVRPGARGDISLDKDETSSDEIAWYQRMAGSYMPTPLLYKGLLYVLYDKGLFACYDAKTGEMVYSKKRLPQGGNFTASPWAYRDHVFCLAEDGQTQVVQAGPEFKVTHMNPSLDEHLFMATPAIAGDSLLIRGSKHLYCIRE